MSIAPRAAHLGPAAILLAMCLRLGSRPAERKLDSGVSMQPSLPFQKKREKEERWWSELDMTPDPIPEFRVSVMSGPMLSPTPARATPHPQSLTNTTLFRGDDRGVADS